jgi:prevent-host-death family protein
MTMVDKPDQASRASTTDQILENYTQKSVGSVRNNFARIIDDVQFYKNTILITEHGRPSAVLMPIDAAKAVQVFDRLGITEKLSNAEYRITTMDELIDLLTNGREVEERGNARSKPKTKRKPHSSTPSQRG